MTLILGQWVTGRECVPATSLQYLVAGGRLVSVLPLLLQQYVVKEANGDVRSHRSTARNRPSPSNTSAPTTTR